MLHIILFEIKLISLMVKIFSINLADNSVFNFPQLESSSRNFSALNNLKAYYNI